MTALTPRQKEIFDFIANYHETHGYSPTVREIQKAFSFSSTASAFKHLKTLQKKELLEKEPSKARAFLPKPASPKEKGDEGALIPLIGAIAKGKKIELFETLSTLSISPQLLKTELTVYGFLAKDQSFQDLAIIEGDILIMALTKEIKTGETILASKDEKAFLGRYEKNGPLIKIGSDTFSETDLKIRGKILLTIRSYSH